MNTELKVELWKLADLKPYPDNPRKTAAAVEPVAASLKRFGFRKPIVIDAAGVIIAGHVLYEAARTLDLARVPVHVARDMSEEEARGYRIADNKTGEYSEWDTDKLIGELTGLTEVDFDLESLGFQAEEMLELLQGEVEPDDDDMKELEKTPAPPDEAASRLGEIFAVGDHRLMCGDSASPEALDALLGGAVIHLVNTDPPYNVKVEPRSNNAVAAGYSSFGAKMSNHQGFDLSLHPEKINSIGGKLRPKDRPLKNDWMSDDDFDQILRAWFGNIARVLAPGRCFYIWGGYANCANYPAPLRETGLYFSQTIIWVKGHPVLTRKDFMGNHEWCFYGWREGAAHQYFGPNNATDVWEVKKVSPQSMIHLTEKPVELAALAIGYSTKPGENVLDLFGGSGSTLMAAEAMGRTAYLMELDPLYCDVIRKRWAEYAHGEGCDWQALTPVVANVAEASAALSPAIGIWDKVRAILRRIRKAA